MANWTMLYKNSYKQDGHTSHIPLGVAIEPTHAQY